MEVMQHRTLLYMRALLVTPKFMKGHSKWDNIKDTKFAAMVHKTKVSEQLMMKMKRVVRAGGPDPKFNKDLVQLQLEYRNANFSDDNFQRALKNVQMQQVKTASSSIRGPLGSIFVVEAEGLSLKKLNDFLSTVLNKIDMEFQVSKNDYSRNFEDKGVIIVTASKRDKALLLDEMEEVCIELDCDDVNRFEENGETFYELVCERSKFMKILNDIGKLGFNVKHSALERRAIDAIEVGSDEAEKITQLYQALRENENITSVYANIRTNLVPIRPTKLKIMQ
ncbi:unnamed protein product [Thelazia callipaeda]|uniref:Transcriptional regulatory protein n=1 Tax=Thelazia callipaeda TaxID=103827 RepID=A0A0N5CQ85_THECL|nr:unnamed protein product [Thelazia callipaeda]